MRRSAGNDRRIAACVGRPDSMRGAGTLLAMVDDMTTMTKSDRRYAARTVAELRRMASEAQDLGDKARVAAIESDIQRILDGWL